MLWKSGMAMWPSFPSSEHLQSSDDGSRLYIVIEHGTATRSTGANMFTTKMRGELCRVKGAGSHSLKEGLECLDSTAIGTDVRGYGDSVKSGSITSNPEKRLKADLARHAFRGACSLPSDIEQSPQLG